MTCDAVETTLALDVKDTLSKNLLLQTPKNDGKVANSCTPGDGCTDSCNDKGVCHSAHTSSSDGSTEDICHCDGGYYGDSCENTDGNDYPSVGNCGLNEMSLTMTMTGTIAENYYGWNFATFSLTDTDDKIVKAYAYDSFCTPGFSSSQERTYCLGEGTYLMRTGDFDGLGFELCDKSGGANFEGLLVVDYSITGGTSCSWVEPPTASPTQHPTSIIDFEFFSNHIVTGISSSTFGNDNNNNMATLAAAIKTFLDYEETTVSVRSLSDTTAKNQRLQVQEDALEVVYRVYVANVRLAGFEDAESAYDAMSNDLETATEVQITNAIQAQASENNANDLEDVSGGTLSVNDAEYPTLAPTNEPGSSSSSDQATSLATIDYIIGGIILVVISFGCLVCIIYMNFMKEGVKGQKSQLDLPTENGNEVARHSNLFNPLAGDRL
jgi:hypothetical protein